MEDALLALGAYVRSLSQAHLKGEVVVLVYPPEREPEMLSKLPGFVDDLNRESAVAELVDVGKVLVGEIQARAVLADRLRAAEAVSPRDALHDFGVIAERTVLRAIMAPLPEGASCRIFCNLGALAAFVSYSAITNQFAGSSEFVSPPTVLAFPGESDGRSLNLLNLRLDTAYRVSRI